MVIGSFRLEVNDAVILMKIIKVILKSLSGKTKKSIMTGIIAAIIIGGVVAAIFGGTNFIGLIVSAAILVAIVASVYFLLKLTDDLPDAFAN